MKPAVATKLSRCLLWPLAIKNWPVTQSSADFAPHGFEKSENLSAIDSMIDKKC